MIRPAKVNDLEAIGALWAELVAYHRQLDDAMPEAAPDGPMLYADRLYDRLDDPNTQAIIAEHDGQVVGFAVGMVVELLPDIFLSEKSGFLADIYVKSEFRGRGFGKALVKVMEEWFLLHGVGHYEWSVAYANQHGRAFWESIGGDNVFLRMRKQLGDDET